MWTLMIFMVTVPSSDAAVLKIPGAPASRQCAALLKLLPREDQALLVRRDAHLAMDLCLDVIDEVEGIHIHGDGHREQVHALDERRSLQITNDLFATLIT